MNIQQAEQQQTSKRPLIPLGRVVFTLGAFEALTEANLHPDKLHTVG